MLTRGWVEEGGVRMGTNGRGMGWYKYLFYCSKAQITMKIEKFIKPCEGMDVEWGRVGGGRKGQVRGLRL